MKILKSLAMAFSLFSKIPAPQFAWEEDNMKYVLCFFPWVGVVIGICVTGWSWLCQRFGIGHTAYLLISIALPILITGGIHADGFMDTMDALHSYQSRERKLEILKDPHIGAFSVIMLLLYYLIYAAVFSEIKDEKILAIVAIGFPLSRTLSGAGALLFRPAKKEGMLKSLSDGAGKKIALVMLLLQFLLCAAGMLLLSLRTGAAVIAGAVGSLFYYRHMSYRVFGGVTGDTAGYFLLLCEGVMVVMTLVD